MIVHKFFSHMLQKTKPKSGNSKIGWNRAGVKPWLDELDLAPGAVWPEEIPKAIRESDIFLACLSKTSVKKTGYIQRELRLALVEYAQRPPGQVYLIPVRLNDCEIPASSFGLTELAFDLSHFHRVDLWKENEFDQLLTHIQDSFSRKLSTATRKATPPGLEKSDWSLLEEAVRDMAAMAGFTAMGYYRNALADSGTLSDSGNPSTVADEMATVASLKALYALEPLASKLNYQYRVFAEELDKVDVAERILSKLVSNPIHSKIKTSAHDFREGWERSLSILIDPIDGTANFDANLPFYCSAVALFLGGRLSISAIYDPYHEHIYYGSLRILPDGTEQPMAQVWDRHAGTLENMCSRQDRSDERLRIATHITRSDENARNRFLQFLPHLYEDDEFKGGTYMLNSGELALAHVAQGNIAAFLNNTTGIWDVAAGEVLIRASGGKVTDFMGREIDYGESSKVSVLACKNKSIHDRLRAKIDEHYPWNI